MAVDDERSVLFILYHTLVCLDEDIIVETAQRADEALERLSNQDFDLVITDLMMPGMSGIELTEILAELKNEAKVIWISAYLDKEAEQKAAELKVAKCLSKTVEVSVIRSAVREALGSNGSAA